MDLFTPYGLEILKARYILQNSDSMFKADIFCFFLKNPHSTHPQKKVAIATNKKSHTHNKCTELAAKDTALKYNSKKSN